MVSRIERGLESALAGLEARVGLVDYIDPALAAHHLAVAMAVFQRFERASDFHRTGLRVADGRPVRAA